VNLTFLRRSLLAAAALSAAGCFDDRVAGGGEILNPPGKAALTGIIRDTEGSPVAGARVRAFPVDHDPIRDSAHAGIRGWVDTTAEGGRFRIEGLDSGRYAVWVDHPGDGRLLFAPDAPADSARDPASGLRLRAPGALALRLPDSLATPGAYLYVPGTPRALRLDTIRGESPRIVFGDLPAGILPSLLLRRRSGEAPRVLATGIRIRSSDTVPLDVLPGWADYRRLRLAGLPSARLTAPLEGYALLVRLDSAMVDFPRTSDDGRDIRFTGPDGTLLPHALESWDRFGRKATAWVRVRIPNPSDPELYLRVHWGSATALMPAGDPAVFGSSLAYAGVWHFQTLAAGAPTRFDDASEASNPALVTGLAEGLAMRETPFGLGLELDGRGAALYTEKRFDNPAPLSLSAWFRTTTDSGGRLLGFNRQRERIDTADVRDRQIWMDDSGRVHFGVYESGVPADRAKHVLSSPAPLNDGAWHHVAGTLGAAGLALYVDGVRVATDSTLTVGQVASGYWRMGFEPEFTDWPHPPSATYFKGSLDEVRVVLEEVREERFRLDVLSQRPGGDFLRPETGD
jgi:hypothetical protein